MGNPNKSAPAQKVEARSRTKMTYSRAGVRWTGEWTEVPKEVIKDEVRFKALMVDPMIDLRVDGNRIVKLEGETPEPKAPEGYVSPEKAKQMRDTYLELQTKHETLISDHQARGQAHAAEVAALNDRIAQLEKRAGKDAAKTDAKGDAKPDAKSTPTIATEGQQPEQLPPVLDPAKSGSQK